MTFIKQPQRIESTSFEIIDEIIATEYPGYQFSDELEKKVITRAVHTTADFDWLDILKFSPDALDTLQTAIKNGCTFYTDTTMALSGINKSLLRQFGCDIQCYIADPTVVEVAKAQSKTRSMIAVEKALQDEGRKVFVFGNAPTALFQLLESSAACPVMTIGVPVGFVGAAESKQALYESDFPFITALGRKGGSNVAAAIVNAVLYHMREAQ
jgi:precorrin-8X/cobalt-precorrin-8 methylmutase